MKILGNGDAEGLKAGVHGAALGLCGVMAIYNAAAFLHRDETEPHLAVNTVVYLLAFAWEAHHLRCHLKDR